MEKKFNFGDNKEKELELTETKSRITILGQGEVAQEGCPKCKSNNIAYTKKTYHGDRVYKCLKCESIFASKTSYAECEKFGIIACDLIINDCFMCPIPKKEGFDVHKLVQEGKACPYFKGLKQLEPDEVK